MSESKAFRAMEKLLLQLGARRCRPKERKLFVIDEFSSDCCLVFDAQLDEDDPDSDGTVDIYVAKPGCLPRDSEGRILVSRKNRRHGVMRFMFAMGVSQFSDTTRKALYELNTVFRQS